MTPYEGGSATMLKVYCAHRLRVRLDNGTYFCRQCEASWDAMDNFPEIIIGYVEEKQ
jgi:hypothetical protein